MTTSIAVALYNGARFLEKQLDSFRNQTQPADKVVFCDDGSKDNTVDMVRNYIEKYHLEDSWFLYENECNLGYAQNFYKAISLCDTDLVFLSDQDDIWKEDKIEKMTTVMEEHPQIDLLSCKYAIIDAQDQPLHSIVEPSASEDEKISPISTREILRAYRWPGMVMCLRKPFFQSLHPYLADCNVAHDLTIAVCAATHNAFYEYHYVGACHRRHNNNTAKEEHRVGKLLNRQRKLSDIATLIQTWSGLLSANLPLNPDQLETISYRLDLLKKREAAIQNRRLWQILKLYRQNRTYLRTKSLICDLCLICFSK